MDEVSRACSEHALSIWSIDEMDPEDIRLGDETDISKLFRMQVYEEDAIANVPDGDEILDTVWSRHWKNGGCRSRLCVRDFKLRPTAAPVSGSDTFAATPSHVALRIFILYMLIMDMMIHSPSRDCSLWMKKIFSAQG